MDKPFDMSRNSFVFTPTALRSLEHDQDLLDRHEYKKQLASSHLSSYMLRKEARDRAPLRPSLGPRAAVCQDLVVQNAVYTGDLEAMQRFFPRGSTVNLIIEPHGGDMRWTTTGEGRRPACFHNSSVNMFWRSSTVTKVVRPTHALFAPKQIAAAAEGITKRHKPRLFIEGKHKALFKGPITCPAA